MWKPLQVRLQSVNIGCFQYFERGRATRVDQERVLGPDLSSGRHEYPVTDRLDRIDAKRIHADVMLTGLHVVRCDRSGRDGRHSRLEKTVVDVQRACRGRLSDQLSDDLHCGDHARFLEVDRASLDDPPHIVRNGGIQFERGVI